MKIGFCFLTLLPFHGKATQSTESLRSKRLRMLQRNKLAWPECKDKQLTPLQCKSLIESEVAHHVIPEIRVKISKPRTAEELVVTGHKVEIMTNYAGIVTGTKNDGIVRYPFQWQGADGTRLIGPWNCAGMGCLECCQKIQSDVTDHNSLGQYIHCFITERGYAVNLGGGKNSIDGIVYHAYEYNNNTGEYVWTELTLRDVEREELLVGRAILAAKMRIVEILTNGSVLYEDLKSLEDNLLVATRARMLGAAQNLSSDIAQFLRNSQGPGIILDVRHGTDLATLLKKINYYIEQFEYQANPPGGYVIIRTTNGGEIARIPELAIDYRVAFMVEDGDKSDVSCGNRCDKVPRYSGDMLPCYGAECEDPSFGGLKGSTKSLHVQFGPDVTLGVPKFCSKGVGEDNENCGDICSSDSDCPPDEGWRCNFECSQLV